MGGLTLGALALLFLEYKTIARLGCMVDNDCYFMLIPVSLFLTLFMLTNQTHIRNPLYLRGMSTINYVMHGSTANVVSIVIDRWNHDQNTVIYYFSVFLITELVCLSVGYLVLRLEYQKGFQVLRYLH